MKKRQIIAMAAVASLSFGIGLLPDNAHAIVEPQVSIEIGEKVGNHELKPAGSAPSVASFYVPVDISVKYVGTYFVSVYHDCSDVPAENVDKCKDGSLLTSAGDTIPSISTSKTFSTMQNEWGFRYTLSDQIEDLSDRAFQPLVDSRDAGYIQQKGVEEIRVTRDDDNQTASDSKVLTLGFGAKVNGDIAAGNYNGKVTVAVVATPSDIISEFNGRLDMAMQAMTSSFCASVPVGTEGSLIDLRDSKVYKVAKLKDENCWMLQNLALEGETTITSADSDVDDKYTLPESSLNGFDVKIDKTQQMYNGTHTDNKNDNFKLNGNYQLIGYGDGSGDNTGAYYTWLVAIANSVEPVSGITGTATGSICPKGWTLPTGGSTGQFKALYQEYGEDRETMDTVWHPGYGGLALNNGVQATGHQVRWWAKNYAGNDMAFVFHDYRPNGNASSDSYNPGGRDNYNPGQSVRCIAK